MIITNHNLKASTQSKFNLSSKAKSVEPEMLFGSSWQYSFPFYFIQSEQIARLPNGVTARLSDHENFWRGRSEKNFKTSFQGLSQKLLQKYGSTGPAYFCSFRSYCKLNLSSGQWFWLSWHSGSFQYQRPAVRIQTPAIFYLFTTVNCTVLKRRK